MVTEALPDDTKSARVWRTRSDPFDESWDTELIPILVADSGAELEATTLLAELRKRHGSRCSVACTCGGLSTARERKVMFEQQRIAGREGAFDFTGLGVTIAGYAPRGSRGRSRRERPASHRAS